MKENKLPDPTVSPGRSFEQGRNTARYKISARQQHRSMKLRTEQARRKVQGSKGGKGRNSAPNRKKNLRPRKFHHNATSGKEKKPAMTGVLPGCGIDLG